MEQDRWKQVDDLAKQALDLSDTGREALLCKAAVTPSIAEDARQILKCVHDAEGFLETPFNIMEDGPSLVPHHIGHHRILEKIGEGGMGIVYLAEQLPPMRRRLALKVVRRGIESKEALARFAAEHQALACMDHPYIAHIYESALTDKGQPYFTMEYLPGHSITDFCRMHHLPLIDRLNLFIKVCEGVQHAHQRGIIHRDLKPSNILIVEQDDVPIPKIIDFGIAKAVGGISLTNLTLFTERGVIMGTPAYMSPEQADARGWDVDTRSDVYALGAILYELLCGTPPYDPRRLRDASLSEILKIICKEEPKPPSTCYQNPAPTLSTRTGLPQHNMARRLRGDLDWITMKSLEKDRSRRYNSAIDLAMDIRRYLENKPVTASPPSRVYRLKKFMHRNRTNVVSAAIALLLLTIGVSERFQAQRHRELMENEVRIANQHMEGLQDFLQEIFSGKDINILQAVEAAKGKINSHAPQARLQGFYGTLYYCMGLYGEARSQFQQAYETALTEGGPHDTDTLDILFQWATVEYASADYEKAEALCQKLLNQQQQAHLPNRATWQTRTLLAATNNRMGRTELAAEMFEALLQEERRLGPGSDYAVTLAYYAESLNPQLYTEKIEALFRRAIDLMTDMDPGDERVLTAKRGYLKFLSNEGNPDALPLARDLFAQRTQKNGKSHPKTLWAAHDLAYLLMYTDKNHEALEIAEYVAETRKIIFGALHRHTLSARSLYTACLAKVNPSQETLNLMQRVYNDRIELGLKAHRATLTDACNIADVEITLGRLDAALVRLHQTKALYANDPTAPGLVAVTLTLVRAYTKAGKIDAAHREWEEAQKLLNGYQAQHPLVCELNKLAQALNQPLSSTSLANIDSPRPQNPGSVVSPP